MKNNLLKLIILILVVGVSANHINIVLGQGSLEEILNSEIEGLNGQIQGKRGDINKIQQKQKEYSEAIEKKQNEKASLSNELAILDNRLAKAQLDIELVETQIDRTELEIKKTDAEINAKNGEIEKEKNHIANILRLMYKRDNVSSLEIMLLNKSLSDFLSQVKYLEDINENVAESLANVEQLKISLEKDRSSLDKQNRDLSLLKKDLEGKKNNLDGEKDNKVLILGQVRSSEKEYQRLLAQAKKEQEQAAAEITNMEKVMRAKLAKLQGDQLGFNDSGFLWPVPKNTITAYFHDPEYPFRYIFEHPAVDIRAGQGTALKAAASGYVARAKNGGMGYSYIMLVHGDGLSTVYGHVSKIYVKEEDYVVQGQTIGLSGGLPGTPGAGGLTTGAHLHFEVRLNGIPMDPLSYLP